MVGREARGVRAALDPDDAELTLGCRGGLRGERRALLTLPLPRAMLTERGRMSSGDAPTSYAEA